jgi:fatty-acid peroxygenase
MRFRDDSLALLTQGYAFLPNRRRTEGRTAVQFGLLGRTAVAGLGPAWTRQFYDEHYIERSTALPGLVKNTLLGDGAVHTLDGEEHRARKAFFLESLDDPGVSALAQSVLDAWVRAEPRWRERGEIVLFEEAANVLLDGAWSWAGLPEERRTGSAAADMLSMVDAFGSAGPRNLRGRRARSRQEQLLSGFVEDVRTGHRTAPPGSVFDAASWLRGGDGELVDPRISAVEILNLVRPTVATAWFLAYAAHALERHPGLRDGLASEDPVPVRSFTHEVRRFYPFAPFVGGTAVAESQWEDLTAQPGDLVVLDIYGQNHAADLWPEPYTFDASRFDGVEIDPYTLIPQGGGTVQHGHRCPGEPGVALILEVLLPRLARMSYDVPEQDDRIPLTRVPTRPRSGMVLRLRP